MVISVVPSQKEDTEAVSALEQEARDSTKDGQNNATNFSPRGSVVIIKEEKKLSFLQSRLLCYAGDAESSTESKQFSKDVSNRPEELAPTDLAYRAVPVREFGAALLRGMGWKGAYS